MSQLAIPSVIGLRVACCRPKSWLASSATQRPMTSRPVQRVVVLTTLAASLGAGGAIMSVRMENEIEALVETAERAYMQGRTAVSIGADEPMSAELRVVARGDEQ